MKSFKEYAVKYESQLENETKEAFFCWGRFNPPTRAHHMLFLKTKKEAEEANASFFIFTSQTADDDRNPLDFARKVEVLEQYFPELSSNIVKNKDVRTLFDTVRKLKENDYNKVTLYVGSDRATNFRRQLRNHFDDIKIDVEQAGATRDSDSDRVNGLSGNKLRNAVKEGDYDTFRAGSPKVDEELVQNVYHDIRRRYGLPSDKPKTDPIEIQTTEEREEFFKGKFQEGDSILKDGRVGEIKSIGSNYLNILYLGEEKIKREWPWEVIKL